MQDSGRKGGGWRTQESNSEEAETSQGHNRHSGRKGDGIKPGEKEISEERGQNQLPCNSPKTSHREWAAHLPVKY